MPAPGLVRLSKEPIQVALITDGHEIPNGKRRAFGALTRAVPGLMGTNEMLQPGSVAPCH